MSGGGRLYLIKSRKGSMSRRGMFLLVEGGGSIGCVGVGEMGCMSGSLYPVRGHVCYSKGGVHARVKVDLGRT